MASTIRGSDNFDSGRFESAQQTITASTLLIIPHGLGVEPLMVITDLECVTDSNGFLAGDKIGNVSQNNSSSGITKFNVMYYDETNVYYSFSSNSTPFTVGAKTGGGTAILTNVNWKLIIKAIA